MRSSGPDPAFHLPHGQGSGELAAHPASMSQVGSLASGHKTRSKPYPSGKSSDRPRRLGQTEPQRVPFYALFIPSFPQGCSGHSQGRPTMQRCLAIHYRIDPSY